MEDAFLGVPDIGPGLFAGLVIATFVTNYFSVVAGTAGGVLLLVGMASFFPPAVLLPLHTLVQFGCGISRAIGMRRYVLNNTLLPFALGCAGGAVIGAQLFVSFSTGVLLGVLGIFVLIVTWLPAISVVGTVTNRFAVLGLGVTIVGVFVSATGTLVGPFTASASPDRRNHVATMAALMSITHLAKMAAYAWVGFQLGAYLPLIGGMIAGGMLGNYAGANTLNRIREEWFRVVFKLVMTVLALRLVWVGMVELGWI